MQLMGVHPTTSRSIAPVPVRGYFRAHGRTRTPTPGWSDGTLVRGRRRTWVGAHERAHRDGCEPLPRRALGRASLARPCRDREDAFAADASPSCKTHDTLTSLARPSRELRATPATGAMGPMRVLHGSITEYVMIVGGSAGTDGHSRCFFAEHFLYILESEQWAYGQGDLERCGYRSGGRARAWHRRGRPHARPLPRARVRGRRPLGDAPSASPTRLPWESIRDSR